MSVLFFKRFLQRPFQIASIIPSSKALVERAAEIAKESAKTGRTVREIAREKKVLPESELNAALDPEAMTEPGGTGSEGS